MTFHVGAVGGRGGPLRLAVGVVVAALALAACGTTNAGAQSDSKDTQGLTSTEIRLGTTNSLTGPVASGCKFVSDGSKAWFDHVNASGGVAGRKISVNTLDDANTPTRAVSNERTFSQDTFALFGGCGTPAADAIAPLLAKAGEPYLFPYAPDKTLWEPAVEGRFLVIPAYADQGAALIKAALQKHSGGRVMAVISKVPGYQISEQAARDATKSAGGTWLDDILTNNGTADYTPVALQIKQANPDVLLLGTGVADGPRLVQAMYNQGYMPQMIVANSASAGEPFIEPGGYLAAGHITMAGVTLAQSSPGAKSCVNALTDAQVSVNSYSVYGCGVAQILTHALGKVGKNLSRSALVAALNNFNKEQASDVFPPLSFSAKDHLGMNSMFVAGIAGKQLVTPGDLIEIAK